VLYWHGTCIIDSCLLLWGYNGAFDTKLHGMYHQWVVCSKLGALMTASSWRYSGAHSLMVRSYDAVAMYELSIRGGARNEEREREGGGDT